MKRIAVTTFVAALVTVGAIAQGSPYVGLETRSIKALSTEQVDDYLAGRGMGFALAAELNAYPGPMHALDMGDSLDLTDAQKNDLEKIRESMSARAVTIGTSIVHLEAQLDGLFASGEINDEILQSILDDISRKQGELRFVHLEAHLRTKAILTPSQIAAYAKLRGYGNSARMAGHHGH